MKPTQNLNDQDLERLLHGLHSFESAPEAAIQRAVRLWKAPEPTALDAVLRRVLAVLSFDSGGAPALAFGRRSVGAGDRQLLFSVDGRDVDLRIVAQAGTRDGLWCLRGQVLGPDLDATVELRVEAYTGSVALNELAEFSFEGVPQGECHLVLRSPDCLIELPPIRIPLAV